MIAAQSTITGQLGILSTIAQITSSDLTSTTTSHMEDAADRELREALDESNWPLKPPVYQWWQPELFASQSIAHHNNVISTSHLPATETVSSMLQRHIDSLADEQTCNGIDMRTGAQPVGPPRGDSARLLAQPLALPYSLSLAHDSIQSTPRALRASAPIRGGGIISLGWRALFALNACSFCPTPFRCICLHITAFWLVPCAFLFFAFCCDFICDAFNMHFMHLI